jgi:hypothetical protein
MHPILTRSDRLALYLAMWLPAGALVALAFASAAPLPWALAAAFAGPLSLAYAFVCLAAWYPCRATPLQTSAPSRVAATHATAALLSAGLWIALAALWSRGLSLLGQPLAVERFRSLMPVLFVTGVLLFVLSSFVHYLLISYETARRSETRSLELDVLARDAELRALRAQVDPHFLFNSLHSIGALIGSDPAGARRMCVLLADLLRDSVKLGGRDHITLGEEFSLVRQYLGIEQVRFGARLEVREQLFPAVEGALVPPLLLQPLVENAVKHGIAGLIEGGLVTIRAEALDGDLVVTIANPYDADREAASRTRVGLQNVRNRLDRQYGPAASLRVTDEAGLYRVVIRMPMVPEPDPALTAR